MKFERLEAARGFAALYVCVGHIVLENPTSLYVSAAFRFGQEAVIVFFILSGFVISWSSLKDNELMEPWRRYFLKRFVRIYSVWGMALIAMFAMASIANREFVLESPTKLLCNALMLQDFSSGKPFVICEAIYGNTPLWSLHYEWWFYMLFPAICMVSNLHYRKHLVGVCAVASSVVYVFYPNPINRVFLYLGIWWIGVHAASVLRCNRVLRLWDIIVPLCYVALSSLPLIGLCFARHQYGGALAMGLHPVLETRHLLTSIGIVLMAFAWRSLKWIGFEWTIGRFTVVAPISFSLYVIHYNSIVHANYLKSIESPLLEFVGYLVTTIVFCVIIELYLYPKIRSCVFFRPSHSSQLTDSL